MNKFEVYRDRVGGFRWRLKARNGEIVAISEAYSSLGAAVLSAKKVKIWASIATIGLL
ncbi:MAG: hypothetical protein QG633_545 [Patescibacteria group bacterium]|jgi:uncharacterized protein YegP (UPF0339 family)|nr:hypothetical protein [Patescibacteria group bacterium]